MTSSSTRNKTQEDVFHALLGIRVGFYKLMDLNVWKDDWTVSIEDDLLSQTGFDREEYQDFLMSEETESCKEFKENFWEK